MRRIGHWITNCTQWDDSSSCLLWTSGSTSSVQTITSSEPFRGQRWSSAICLFWCGHCLDVVHRGINSFPLAALLKEQKCYPHLYTQLEALRGWAVFMQEAYSKHSNRNPMLPALPAFLFAQVSPSKCFSDVFLGSELTLCKSRITPGTQAAAYQPFLSSYDHLPLFVTSWTNLLSYISH